MIPTFVNVCNECNFYLTKTSGLCLYVIRFKLITHLSLISNDLFSPVNPVLRSASFHGTRQLTVSSSDEEEEEITLSAEDEEWPVLQAPKVCSHCLAYRTSRLGTIDLC